ncbi:MAG: hypothetical protein ACT4OQ_03385 [Chloroflexota bacterium]
MTRDDDFIRQLEGYLEDYDGTTPLPEPVRDAVRARLPMTAQLPAWWPERRSPTMNTMMRVALASAAAVAAAIIGLNVLQLANIGDRGPSDPSPSPTSEAQQGLGFWSGFDLPAGEYLVDDPFPHRIRITVPEGWESHGVAAGLASLCSNECQLPERSGLAFWDVTNVYTDPCDPGGLADPPVGPNVDVLVTALTELPRHEASAPTATSVGGLDATYLELTADTDLGDCSLGGLRGWIAGSDARTSPPGDHDRLWILEVDGRRLMIDIASPSDASASEIAELEGMVDSIRFEPAGG